MMKTQRVMILSSPLLEVRRMQKGLLRREVAQRAGVGLLSVHRAFSSKPVGPKVARAVARVLGLNLADLIVPQCEITNGGK